MSVLKAENISLSYNNSTTPVLENIYLNIPESSLTVILGESGCGKMNSHQNSRHT